MMNSLGAHFQRPDEARLSAYAKFVGLFCLFFFPVFFGVGALGAHFGRAMPLYLEWETGIPCFPSMVWVYLSAFALWVLPLIHLSPWQIDRLSRQVIVTILIAGVGYLTIPGKIGYPEADFAGVDGAVIAALDSLAARSGNNLVPSLHVAFGAIVIGSCLNVAPPALSRLYVSWLVLLSISTVLTHQHHLLDVVAGFALALMVRRLLPIDPVESLRPRQT